IAPTNRGCRWPLLLAAKHDTRSMYRSPLGPYRYTPSARSISISRGESDVCAVLARKSCRLLSICKATEYFTDGRGRAAVVAIHGAGNSGIPLRPQKIAMRGPG